MHYKMVDDCLVLLSYCSKHRGEWQTKQGLANELGIPEETLRYIIHDADLKDEHSLLWGVAWANGYAFCIMHRVGAVIDVEKRGYLRRQ